MRTLRKALPLAVAGAALIWALPAVAANKVCLDKNQNFSVTPADGKYCWCIASLTKKELRKYRIDAEQVDECLMTTGSLFSPSLITFDPAPPPDGEPPPAPIPPPNGGVLGKGNNGLGNGSDPAPPGIGNAGNDGGNVAVGSVAVTPGSPGGSTSAPGQNK